jgi:phenylalanyl-tRNA synthetase alpha chain
MEDVNKQIASLHPLERKILPLIPSFSQLADLMAKSGLKEIEVMRALQWLKNKGIISLKEELRELIFLERNGQEYQKHSLPERRFLVSLNREMSLKDIEKASGLEKEELNVSLGLLKRKIAINIIKRGNDTFISLTDTGRNMLKKDLLEELLLKKVFPLDPKSLTPEEVYALNELKKRSKILRQDVQKIKTAILTELGSRILRSFSTQNKDVIESLTPELLKSKMWQGKDFRTYDLKASVPRMNYGKKHFENEAIDYVKSIWVSLGFKEMSGTMVQTAFWDLDTLFVPQDHPAREMQDTFYLKNPSSGKIPEDLKKKVKAVHESGADTGSKGWGGIWGEEKAKKLLLRTHTTVLSAQTISKLKKQDLPLKFFSVQKVFRNEALDWKHLFEFYQVEGIVVDPNATFENLKWYLEEFFGKMGFNKIKIRPSYFPYTEPSVEVEVYLEDKKQWIELGGAGIFRPEVTKTLLGFECPVLAWGLGLGRIAVPYYGINDLREFNRNDLKQLKGIKKWLLQPKG